MNQHSRLRKLGNSKLLSMKVLAISLKIASAGIVFILNLIVARQLGISGAGYFFLGFSILNILSAISRLGYENILVRFISIEASKSNNLQIQNIYQICINRSIPMTIVIATLAFYFSDSIATSIFNKPNLSETLSIVGLALLPFTFTWLNSFAFQGLNKIEQSISFQFLSIPLVTVVLIYALEVNTSESAMWCIAIAALISMILSCFLLNRTTPLFNLKDYNDSYKSQINPIVMRLYGIQIMGLLIQWLPVLALGVFATTTEVSIFSTSLRTAMLVSFLLPTLNALTAPKYASFFHKGEIASIQSMALKTSKLLFLMGTPCIVILVVYSKTIMNIFGSEFTAGYISLIILGLGQYVNILTGSVGYILQMTGHEKLLHRNLLISSSILCIGCFTIVPIYGAIGASCVTAIAVSTQNLLSVWHVKKNLGFNVLTFWKK